MALTRQDWQTFGGLALVIGLIEFAVATLVEGALIPGYGLLTHWVSDLGPPPNAAPTLPPARTSGGCSASRTSSCPCWCSSGRPASSPSSGSGDSGRW
jgi:hypothetical protein